VLADEALPRRPSHHADSADLPQYGLAVGVAVPVAAPHDREQAGAEIGVAERHPDLPSRRDRHARHDDVGATRQERRDLVVPVHLAELERPAERTREGAGEVHLQADQLATLPERERR
jgi:hypothetical protein